MPINIDAVHSKDFQQLSNIQAEIWGKDNQMPASLFSIANTIGGCALGAYHDQILIGFILSLPAVWNGKKAQWSCRLAVDESFRNQGIGSQLKEAQKKALLTNGINSLLWSFNPYDTKNAHLNLNKLGAKIVGFKEGMYPVVPGERAIVEWHLQPSPSDNLNHHQNINVPTSPSPDFCASIKKVLADGFVGTMIDFDSNQPYYQFSKHD